VVLSPPAAPRRFEPGNGGPQPGGEPEDPDDPSSSLGRHVTVATPAAGGLALSL
jgi:hypothetical protein